MLTLPETYCTLISEFALVFSKRIWHHAQVLLVGAILTPGKGTVTSALRVMGLSDEQHFQNYHRVLSRAVWSSLEVSRILLMLLVNTFVPKGPVVMGIDETLERRRGGKIRAKGIYRDPVRSSRSHFVKTSGLRCQQQLKSGLFAVEKWLFRTFSEAMHGAPTTGLFSARNLAGSLKSARFSRFFRENLSPFTEIAEETEKWTICN